MMDGLYLTAEQILAGEATLTGDAGDRRLKVSQVDDLMSIFRKYLKNFVGNFPIRSTFEALRDDGVENNRCAKLAACLLLWQDVQFDVSEFAATNANRTGYTDSTIKERFDIFEYAFCLFWDLPSGVSSGAVGSSSFSSFDGFTQKY
jgi:hypothetical protein